tara:strand:+ start:730 stop:1380 length:651 start_codon:yes stop_codon:yes gene_type:complete
MSWWIAFLFGGITQLLIVKIATSVWPNLLFEVERRVFKSENRGRILCNYVEVDIDEQNTQNCTVTRTLVIKSQMHKYSGPKQAYTKDVKLDEIETLFGRVVPWKDIQGEAWTNIDMDIEFPRGAICPSTTRYHQSGIFPADKEFWHQKVGNKCDWLFLVIKFPQSRPIKSYDVCIGESGTRRHDLAQVIKIRGRQALALEIRNPKKSASYQLEWEW